MATILFIILSDADAELPVLSTILYYLAISGSEATVDAELPGMNCCASETEINGICYSESKIIFHCGNPSCGNVMELHFKV